MQTLILNKIILPKIPGIVIGPIAVTDYLISQILTIIESSLKALTDSLIFLQYSDLQCFIIFRCTTQ